jgi:hypothetical protein
VVPVVELRPVVGVAIAAMVKRPITATVKRRRGAEPAAMKTAAAEATAMEASTVEATAVKATAAATVEPTTMAATTTMTATTAVAAANLDHQSIAGGFR